MAESLAHSPVYFAISIRSLRLHPQSCAWNVHNQFLTQHKSDDVVGGLARERVRELHKIYVCYMEKVFRDGA